MNSPHARKEGYPTRSRLRAKCLASLVAILASSVLVGCRSCRIFTSCSILPRSVDGDITSSTVCEPSRHGETLWRSVSRDAGEHDRDRRSGWHLEIVGRPGSRFSSVCAIADHHFRLRLVPTAPPSLSVGAKPKASAVSINCVGSGGLIADRRLVLVRRRLV
jgi:hypothetical protein